MFRNLLRVAICAALAGALVWPAAAWNSYSHMSIGYVAYQKLTPRTRARVNQLLRLNPYYPKWEAMIPAGNSPADKDLMIFMIATSWPDQLRNDPDYHDDGPQGGNRPGGAEASRNIGYGDHLRHKYWHFVDLPFSQDGTALPAVPSPNAQTQIAAFRAALASSNSDDVKSYDLVWLLHIVGDVHQPLHCAARVRRGQPHGDAGGNFVKVCAPECTWTLHWYWDSPQGPNNAPIAEIIAASKQLPAAPKKAARIRQESVWVAEGFRAAQQYVYAPPVGPDGGPYTLDANYTAAARALTLRQVALAGARLANLLNRELK
jgi:hypothetical protein